MEAQNQEQSASAGKAKIARKPYQPPALVPWGTLRDVTQAVGAQGASDGGTKQNKRGTR
ncbi:MAG: lasso RiPP family leader peptide-containing protein [Reyranella sp.]|uniref:lasso RiPP family leader peptide-containing protein n=1 Tax=Reyranella sp. TaxID=1929291 RepID=UPI003D0EA577